MLVLSTPKAGELSGTLSGPARLAGSKLPYQSTPIASCMAADLEEKTTRYERLLQEVPISKTANTSGRTEIR